MVRLESFLTMVTNESHERLVGKHLAKTVEDITLSNVYGEKMLKVMRAFNFNDIAYLVSIFHNSEFSELPGEHSSPLPLPPR